MSHRVVRWSSFRDTLPAGLREALWLPVLSVTLTLPDDQGVGGTTFEVWRCPTHRQDAFNVTGLVRAPEATR